MRISDWSSDVCSSDLPGSARDNKPRRTEPAQPKLRSTQSRRFPLSTPNPQGSQGRPAAAPYWRESQGDGCRRRRLRQNNEPFSRCATLRGIAASGVLLQTVPRTIRSEEHTSELQSLMRISYAVFCLNKKNHNTQ